MIFGRITLGIDILRSVLYQTFVEEMWEKDGEALFIKIEKIDG